MTKYTETQRFNQPWIWIILAISGLIPVGIFGTGLYEQMVKKHPFGINPMSDNALMVTFSIILLIFILMMALFRSLSLKTLIDEKGISYRFFPFHFKFRKINWEDIERVEVIKYNPILDYGGWGVRFGKKGKAFNVSGDKGLYIYLMSGKNLLIGTHKEEELKQFINGLKPGKIR